MNPTVSGWVILARELTEARMKNRPSTLLGVLVVMLALAALAALDVWRPRSPSSNGQSWIQRRVDEVRLRLFMWQHMRRTWGPVEARDRALQEAFQSGRAVRVSLPYRSVQGGEWIRFEQAVGRFAGTNSIEIIRFENAGKEDAHVCVWSKDAAAMNAFVNSIADGATKDGPAKRLR